MIRSRQRAAGALLCAVWLSTAVSMPLGGAPLDAADRQGGTPSVGANPGAATEGFAESLILRVDRLVVDSTHTAIVWLAQTRPASYAAQGPLRLVVELKTTDPETKAVKTVGRARVLGGDLAARPFPISVDLSGMSDGRFQYVATVNDGETVLRTLAQPVTIVAGLDAAQADVERRLAKITGHESAKASIRYPFDLARVMNAGKRVYGSANNNPEFGLSQAGEPQLYNFTAGVKRSGELLAALEKGRDLVWQARGEMVRHYHMAEADEILPYRVFVPSTWNGRSPLPLMFILHGNSRDQDYYFDRDGRIIPKTAEKHGYMVVAPLGYSPNGGYNYVPYGRASGRRGVAGAMATPQVFGPDSGASPPARGGRGGPAGFGGVNGSVTPALVRSEWSEQDAMHVFDLIRQEYPIDPKRTFLFGYSAGGQGSHYLGPKFAEHWAAIAIGGSNAMPADSYPFARLVSTPMMIFVGMADGPNLNPSRAMSQALQQHGVPVVLKEYEGANHDTAPSAAIADIFTFFDAHPRK